MVDARGYGREQASLLVPLSTSAAPGLVGKTKGSGMLQGTDHRTVAVMYYNADLFRACRYCWRMINLRLHFSHHLQNNFGEKITMKRVFLVATFVFKVRLSKALPKPVNVPAIPQSKHRASEPFLTASFAVDTFISDSAALATVLPAFS